MKLLHQELCIMTTVQINQISTDIQPLFSTADTMLNPWYDVRLATVANALHKKLTQIQPPAGLGVCRCLQDNRDANNFTQGCKAEVEKYEQTASTDYRYLPGPAHGISAVKQPQCCHPASLT